MNGDRWLLDTNAVVALLGGATGLSDRLRTASWIGISIISRIEFLAFRGLVPDDVDAFGRFLQRIEVVGLTNRDEVLINKVIKVRQASGLKLPDAIIAATALTCDANLVTADADFHRVPDLKVVAPA